MTVELPCHPEVRHYLMQELPADGDAKVLRLDSSVGKMIVQAMENKRLYVYKKRDWPNYRTQITISIPYHIVDKGRAGLSPRAVMFINSFVRNTVQEHLFTYLRISLIIDPRLNIRKAVLTWMLAMDMNDDIKSLDTHIRVFRAWRSRKYPNLTRSIGRPKKNSRNSSYLSVPC